jgi:hypothetical protein
MSQQAKAVAVLARFPDVADHTKPQPRADGETQGWNLLGPSGRWIGQAMSIKLLAGITLFLLVGAILPFCLVQKSPTPNPSAWGDTLSSWQPKQAGSPTENGSAQNGAVATTGAYPPVVRVSATSDQLPPPAMLPPTVVAQRQPPPPTVAESLMSPRATTEAKPAPLAAPTVAETGMSRWSPPGESNLPPGKPGNETSASNTNRGAEAARSPEYEANARGHRPEEPAARFDGTIEGTKR